ncbi:MAG: hydrogenase maturation protease [Deltaproteobacteria bacterium]|nr:hydrogenase maturation protease [Deltaproteobacteria bacterium]
MKAERKRPRILVVGLGNLLLRDDGVGVHAVRALREKPLPRILCAEVGTAVLDSLHLLSWADKVLAIDAMAAGSKPGTVYSFGVMDVAENRAPASLHELGLLSALRFLPRKTKTEIRILGIEPEIIEYGLELTPAVRQALPRVTQAAKEIVALWKN